ncbi:hypothetical protein HMPREF9952_0023 [Haemophilus pittmaniae HK 85]|uniref:Uncharacterized protein n=1 Tax=Haemophilus pittmaniae HK 85 TaxID=1035188 RepID=F9Q816_9PAST|nr:hypothetical protein HMPREF9952_0023 [Haemophilus pittmaniae HK 85]
MLFLAHKITYFVQIRASLQADQGNASKGRELQEINHATVQRT